LLDLGKEYSNVEITIMGIDGVIEKNYRLNHIKVASLNMPDADGIYMVTLLQEPNGRCSGL
jgi:hypothetical protein